MTQGNHTEAERTSGTPEVTHCQDAGRGPPPGNMAMDFGDGADAVSDRPYDERVNSTSPAVTAARTVGTPRVPASRRCCR